MQAKRRVNETVNVIACRLEKRKQKQTAVSSVAKRTGIGAGGLGFDSRCDGPVRSAQDRLWFATTATYLRSCVALALSRGDGRRHSFHSSA